MPATRHVQAQAGVIKGEGAELTSRAKQVFIEDTKALMFGLDTPRLSCGAGSDSNPDPGVAINDLEDEEKFPDFHSMYLGPNGLYTKAAIALDVIPMVLVPPFMDPFHFCVALNILPFPDIDFKFSLDPQFYVNIALPTLPSFKPPDIALKFPILQLPEIPKIEFDIDLRFDAQLNFFLKYPELLLKIPSLALKLKDLLPFQLPDLPSILIKLTCPVLTSAVVIDKKYTLQYAAARVLANKIGDSMQYAITGLVVGCPDPAANSNVPFPGFGAVGIMGESKGLGKQAAEVPFKQKQADIAKKEQITMENVRKNAIKLLEQYVPSGFGQPEDPGQKKFMEITDLTMKQLEDTTTKISTCGFLPHWMLWRLGVRNPKILNRNVPPASYYDEQNISRLISGAQAQDAWVPYAAGKSPKPGDIVHIQLKQGGGSASEKIIEGAEGKQVDKTKDHVFVVMSESTVNGTLVMHSADAGDGGWGKQKATMNQRYRKGNFVWTDANQKGKIIVGWVDISKLKYEASAQL